MNELKKCPFCGGRAEVYKVKDYPESIGKRYSVICCKCGAQVTTIFQQKGQAIDAWNQRADGWISVDERLPNFDGYYLAATVYGVCILGFEHTENIWADEDETPYLPTHWQPLPQPPQQAPKEVET